MTTSSEGQFISLSQPNSNQTEAELFWKTFLPANLFQQLSLAIKVSSFVQSIFVRFPRYACASLVWQAKFTNAELEAKFPNGLHKEFDAFISERPMLLESDILRELRVFRRCHSAAIAVLELNESITIDSTSFRISGLADILIRQSYQYARSLLAPRFGLAQCNESSVSNLIILGMGKLGGQELNFSSDIDLIFFYSNEGETVGGSKCVSYSRYFQKLAMLVIRLLDEVNEEGFVYRVDMRLRPYGESGALVMSLAQAEDYYQEQGREWERFAMVRARAITGGDEEISALDQIIRPFCFRKYIDYSVLESIRSMKAMIVREVRRKGLRDNIKLGAGGIREIEFIVQALQLIQGGRDKRLTERSVFKVLPLIVDAKLLPQEVAGFLLDAYRELRRVEHCIQEFDEKQTQQLPESPEAKNNLALVMGKRDWDSFYVGLQATMGKVHQHFNDLLGEARNKELEQDDFFQSLFEGIIDVETFAEKIRKDFHPDFSIAQAQNFISELGRFLESSQVSNLSARGAERIKAFFPALLATCSRAESPDLVLGRLLRILQSILKRTAYLDLLSENPPILSHLVDLAGKSEWIVKRLSEYPILFDELLYPNSLYAPLQTADLESELRQSLLRINANDEEDLLDSLRAFKQINELRVAAALLAERLSISQVSRYLTQLAQVLLGAAVEMAWQMVVKRHGKPSGLKDHETGFAVIGYGKLGGMELGFGSDLDLVFLFNQSVDESTDGERPVANTRFYTRLAQKLIHILSTRTNQGLLYEVDMRLRPSGASGLLVSHVDAYDDYQMESAWTWEHQALIRARFITGDSSLLPQFERARDRALKKPRKETQLKEDVSKMRIKMREQLLSQKAGLVDLKQGEGGLVDIEFLAQFLCLKYQGELPIPYNTVDCLKFCQHEGMLSEKQSLILVKNYREFRNRLNENALMNLGDFINEQNIIERMQDTAKIWTLLME